MPRRENTDIAPSQPLVRLVGEDPDGWSYWRLWSRMPLELREEAVAAVLESGAHRPLHGPLRQAMARAAGFRHQTVEKMAPAEAARLIGRVPRRDVPLLDELFPAFLTLARSELLSAYLDGLGVPNTDGIISDDWDGSVSPGAAAKAAEALLEEFPADDVLVYLVVLVRRSSLLAPGIPDWLGRRFAGAAEGEAAEGPDGPPATEVGDLDAAEPELVREARDAVPEEGAVPGRPFSPLDRTLIRAAVDCVQGVEGAPEPAMMEDMVDELLALNSSRHISYFHRGFLDALSDGAYRESFPAENEPRRSWYLVGWLSGLARQDRHQEIVQLLDSSPHADGLKKPGAPWAGLALPLLFEALCRQGREPEGARILSPGYLVHNPTLLPALLREGTRLLREDDAERARALFDRLGQVVELLEAEGEPVTEGFFLEVRRRRAHCYRQLGEAERARELLERLLEEERDADIQAMVLADLGLLDGGFRSLADVRLWHAEAERTDILNALERGRARFQAALETGSRFGSHGAWPLAVLALARDEAERARELLSLVISSFLERPNRYGERRLLARVKVAAGIAEALVMDYTRLGRARELLEAGLEEGARIPRPLLPSVLSALDAHEEELAESVLTRVLEREGPGVLDHLGELEVTRQTPAVATHLMAHARKPEVPADERARALRRTLPILLSQHPPRLDAAREALDTLESLAREGVGSGEFLELLSEPAAVDPAWDRENAAWARITILEAAERYDDAVAALRGRLADVLASPGWETQEEARAIVARARSYGLDRAWIQDLEGRLEAWEREYGEAEEPSLPPTHPNQPYRILIVGGDEGQHDLERRVLAHLEADGESIRVKHIPTGWSGNWARTLEETLSAAQRHDAVVLLRYMRTEFGRSLRAALEIPWVSCPGVGTTQVARMVRKAAVFAGGRRG